MSIMHVPLRNRQKEALATAKFVQKQKSKWVHLLLCNYLWKTICLKVTLLSLLTGHFNALCENIMIETSSQSRD